MNRGLTQTQIIRLMTSIDPAHVEQKRGMSYMAQHQVRAELTRIFGVGNWDTQVESMSLLYETMLEKGNPQFPTKGTAPVYWVACYRAAVRLNIRDYWGNPIATFVEHHAEECAPLPNRGEAHAMAITSVESYALRRAAIGLGDRLGLGLYDKGSQAPLVQRTLQLDDPQSPQVFTPPNQAPAIPAAAPVAMPAEVAEAVTHLRTGKMDDFAEARDRVQTSNAAARAAAGFKHDERDGASIGNHA